ncbi:MAG TPA: 5-deoxy-glucuronate isomerase, partial [Edaphobacter sp.]
MSERLVRDTASQMGRNIFVQPGSSSMREVSYGRIRLGGVQRQVSFANEGQETGLICVQGECVVLAGGEHFVMSPQDALYVPKGLSITVETDGEVDLVECSAPVDGEYPLQFVSAADVRADEK